MFRPSIVLSAVFAFWLAFPCVCLAQTPTAAGFWEKLDAAGRPQAEFRIYQCGGTYFGNIVNIVPKPGEDPSQWRCTECKGDQQGMPVEGITFIKGMKRSGLRYGGGTILDPRDGSVYDAQMQLSPDGNTLTVRGYLFIPMLGQNEVWRRVDDAPAAGPPNCQRASGHLRHVNPADRAN